MLRVLHVTDTLANPGGVEHGLLNHGTGLIQRGYELTVLAAQGGTFATELQAAGMHVEVCETVGATAREHNEAFADEIARCAARFGADLVHAHQHGPIWAALTSEPVHGLPVIASEHARVLDWMDERHTAAVAELWPHAQAVFCFGQPVAQQLASIGVPAGLLRGHFQGVPADGTRAATVRVAPADARIGYLGRLDPRKAPDVLVDAFVILRDLMPAAQLHIVGSGPQRDELDAQLARVGERGVTMHGALFGRAAERFVRGMDVMALSSRVEGFPGAPVEALAAGIPVVCTSPGAEVLFGGELGLLVPPQNPHLLAHALHAELTDPARRDRAVVARERIHAHFSRDAAVDLLDNVYRDAAGH